MTFLRKVLHWTFEHPAHRHHYRLEVEMDDHENIKPYWRCIFILCDRKIEIDEWPQ